MDDSPRMNRVWAMPSPWTFSIPPIARLLSRWLKDRAVIIDPFCGRSTIGTLRNDLAESGKDAVSWLSDLADQGVVTDALLFDPPYSPRQISEAYRAAGLPVGMKETQNALLYREARSAADRLLRAGGIAISCGWNSAGFGKERGYRQREILLVAHGGAHNDTIVVVEEKAERFPLLSGTAGGEDAEVTSIWIDDEPEKGGEGRG